MKIRRGFAQSDEAMGMVQRLMNENQPLLTYRMIRALRGIYPASETEYLLGVFFLEFAGILPLSKTRYLETSVSFRRARRHLRRALKARPGEAKIMAVMGESYSREQNWRDALSWFERASAADAKNPRYAWAVLENRYLLGEFDGVLSAYEGFRWDECGDDAYRFWSGAICVYAAARLNQELSARVDLVQRIDVQALPQPDLAAMCLMDALYLAGRDAELAETYERCAELVACLDEPVVQGLRSGTLGAADRAETVRRTLEAFTPIRILAHLP